MSRKEDYMTLNYVSRTVSRTVNEYSDEVELETVMYQDHSHAVATICENKPPFKDYFAEASDLTERGAAKIALQELYRQAYFKN